jgi:hypothetical protein
MKAELALPLAVAVTLSAVAGCGNLIQNETPSGIDPDLKECFNALDQNKCWKNALIALQQEKNRSFEDILTENKFICNTVSRDTKCTITYNYRQRSVDMFEFIDRNYDVVISVKEKTINVQLEYRDNGLNNSGIDRSRIIQDNRIYGPLPTAVRSDQRPL